MLEVNELMASARALATIESIDEAAIEPLTMLVAALNNESQLHPEGKAGMRSKLIRILANRLRMQRDFSAHPEIADEVIIEPVFICGMGRTGSTKTHKLLAASGDFNWLPYWQVTNPSLISGDRSEDPQIRIDNTEDFVRWFDAASPETKSGHPFAAHEPEEESFILEQSLVSPVWMGWAPLGSYLGWIMTQDMTQQFIYLRDTLKYLQWQGLTDRAKPWLLKSPLYSGMEPLLLQTFPDARLLMTHRHPVITIPSGLRLLECFYKPFSSARPDPVFYCAGQAQAINAHLDIRERVPDIRFLDIDFPEVVGPPDALANKIWGYLDRSLSDGAIHAMRNWESANPQNKHGRHAYSLEQYGLNSGSIETQFSRYSAFLEGLSAPPSPN